MVYVESDTKFEMLLRKKGEKTEIKIPVHYLQMFLMILLFEIKVKETISLNWKFKYILKFRKLNVK